uniref:B-cell receptor CD22-like n=1 Tax=Semicossyphus pulcher TaxID=241346 RepID=UPI0037E9C4DB
MAATLLLLITGCLLQGALCGEFEVTIPQTIEVLRGSCVTIPCSFDIRDEHQSNLDSTCKALWNDGNMFVFDSSAPQQSQITGKLTGDLMKKDCTTTLNNMQPRDSNNYYFRLQCENSLRYDFSYRTLSITFTDNPPRPTLNPSTLKVKEGTSVTLTCSARAPCLSLSPTLTWTPGLGEGQETLRENQDKTKIKTSVVKFNASHLHHRQEISCTAVYKKQDGSTESSVKTSITADISFSPKGTTVSVRPSGPVQEDQNVTLTCSSSANPAVKNYTWYGADGGRETSVGTGRDFNIKASKDSGAFFCKAENDLGAGQSNNTQMDVQYSPKGTTVSVRPSGPVQEGSIVTLTCSSSANPAVKNYTWYGADGGWETFVGTGRVFQMKASQVSGPFFCKAENDLGAGRSNNTQIDVQYPEQLFGPYGGVLLNEDKTEVMVFGPSRGCDVPPIDLGSLQSYVKPIVTNLDVNMDSQEALRENQDKTKIKTSVVKFTASHLHHKQEISCTAVYKKQDGSTESSVKTSITADISFSPKGTTVSVRPSGPVQEDQNVTLTCSSSANPAVKNYTWYGADGGRETFVGTGRDFKIKASQVSGAFFCKAENDLGARRSNNTQIDVQYSPKGTTVSVRPSGPVQEGSIVTLTCSSSANPAVKNYTWYRADGGRETFVGTGRVFQMKASQVSGPFFCKAENDLGAGRSNNTQIDVQYPEQLCGPYGGVLVLAVTGVSLTVNIILTFCMVYLWKQRKNVKPQEQGDGTYMSMDHRDRSPEYDVIGQRQK